MKDSSILPDRPLVSVIMTAYNTGAYIRKSIDSILAQSYDHFELLIADDASSDNTREIISTYNDPRITVHHNPFRMHYLSTCNKLFSLCKGDLITFQDSDDWSTPDRLQTQVNAFLSDPRIGSNSVNFIKVDESGENELFRSDLPRSGSEVMSRIPETFPVLAGAIMVRRDVLEYVGYYNTFFNKVGSEHLYWFYLILEKFKFVNIPTHHYFYRFNPTSFTNRDTLKHCNHLIAHEALRYLVHQRRTTGTDCIENNNLEEVGRMFNKILRSQKYKIMHADRLSWNGYYRESFKVLLKATSRNPLIIFKTFKRIFSSFRKIKKQATIL